MLPRFMFELLTRVITSDVKQRLHKAVPKSSVPGLTTPVSLYRGNKFNTEIVGGIHYNAKHS